VTEVLEGAFAALGLAPTKTELELVAKALIAAGDTEALDLLYWDEDSERFEVLAEIAERAGSSAFTALDLATQVHHPNWREEREARGIVDATRRRAPLSTTR
jgi:hypothetical protein